MSSARGSHDPPSSRPGSDRPASREAAEVAFWREVALGDPEVGFVILDGEGRVLLASELAGEILLGSPAASMLSLTLAEIFSPPIATERAEYLRRAVVGGRGLTVGEVWRGVRCRSVWRAFPPPGRPEVLWTVRRAPLAWPDAEPTRYDAVEARQVDWGPLSPLTPMQRRVLGLLASGLSGEQAAGATGLSPDEVQAHTLAIERALRTTSLAVLTRRAVTAGLVPG